MQSISSSSLAQPQGSYTLVQAVAWLRDLLLGSLGVSVAALAVAAIGLLALSGRVDIRRAATAILGCFVLFGAPVIGTALFDLFIGNRIEQPQDTLPLAPEPSQAPPAPTTNLDPYAGAAVPPQ